MQVAAAMRVAETLLLRWTERRELVPSAHSTGAGLSRGLGLLAAEERGVKGEEAGSTPPRPHPKQITAKRASCLSFLTTGAQTGVA